MLLPLLMESVDEVFSRPVGNSGGAEAEVPSTVSGMAGICTGMGRSMESLELTAIGIGILSDSLRGLTM
jgi:hypothetical protein